MRTRIIVSILLIFSFLFPLNSAQAAWIQYQTSPADTINRPDLPAAYDLTVITFGVSDTDPDEYWFFLSFAKPVTSTLFADARGSWGAVFLDTNNDGKDDYSLETSTVPYNGNLIHPGTFVDRTPVSPVISNKCVVDTWTNLDKNASWIGFSIKKNCISFASTIGVWGFADHIAGDSAEYDNAPDINWKMSVTGGAITAAGNSSSTIVSGQLPSVSTEGLITTGSPASPPDDLVALAAETTKSVVTVLCGSGLGSGWSIHTNLSSANITNGYKSYIITNHHVIADCKTNRNIFIILANQVKVPAYVYSWDEANDVAGIMTTTVIPALEWRGFTPQQGWWTGVLGSPLGFPGILTIGIVSSINSSTFLGTTNAAINSGNSGGPVFDRQGRVLGLATAKYLNSEGFGIFHGTPLLCYKIVLCTGTSQIWLSAADKAIADKAIADKAIADKVLADLVDAAVDAANEATDAANAAVDAANAAAEQADAATAAAQDAADAVESLATAVAELMADLKAQIEWQKAAIASLTSLVVKLQKK